MRRGAAIGWQLVPRVVRRVAKYGDMLIKIVAIIVAVRFHRMKSDVYDVIKLYDIYISYFWAYVIHRLIRDRAHIIKTLPLPFFLLFHRCFVVHYVFSKENEKIIYSIHLQSHPAQPVPVKGA